MSEFTIVEWRKLGEALEQNERFGGNDQIILAAARRDYDRYQECGNPSCDGGFFTDRWAASEREWLEGTHERPCPSCGGSGLQPKEGELVRWCFVHKRSLVFPDSPMCADGAGLSHCAFDWRTVTRVDDAEAAVRAFDKETE